MLLNASESVKIFIVFLVLQSSVFPVLGAFFLTANPLSFKSRFSHKEAHQAQIEGTKISPNRLQLDQEFHRLT